MMKTRETTCVPRYKNLFISTCYACVKFVCLFSSSFSTVGQNSRLLALQQNMIGLLKYSPAMVAAMTSPTGVGLLPADTFEPHEPVHKLQTPCFAVHLSSFLEIACRVCQGWTRYVAFCNLALVGRHLRFLVETPTFDVHGRRMKIIFRRCQLGVSDPEAIGVFLLPDSTDPQWVAARDLTYKFTFYHGDRIQLRQSNTASKSFGPGHIGWGPGSLIAARDHRTVVPSQLLFAQWSVQNIVAGS
jgi:hypothetical protein